MKVCLSSFCTGGGTSGKSVYDLDGPRIIPDSAKKGLSLSG